MSGEILFRQWFETNCRRFYSARILPNSLKLFLDIEPAIGILLLYKLLANFKNLYKLLSNRHFIVMYQATCTNFSAYIRYQTQFKSELNFVDSLRRKGGIYRSCQYNLLIYLLYFVLRLIGQIRPLLLSSLLLMIDDVLCFKNNINFHNWFS